MTYNGTLKYTDVMCYTPPSYFPFKFNPIGEHLYVEFLYKNRVKYTPKALLDSIIGLSAMNTGLNKDSVLI